MFVSNISIYFLNINIIKAGFFFSSNTIYASFEAECLEGPFAKRGIHILEGADTEVKYSP